MKKTIFFILIICLIIATTACACFAMGEDFNEGSERSEFSRVTKPTIDLVNTMLDVIMWGGGIAGGITFLILFKATHKKVFLILMIVFFCLPILCLPIRLSTGVMFKWVAANSCK